MVGDLYRGERGSKPKAIADLGGTVFFTAVSPATGRELWTIVNAGRKLDGSRPVRGVQYSGGFDRPLPPGRPTSRDRGQYLVKEPTELGGTGRYSCDTVNHR